MPSTNAEQPKPGTKGGPKVPGSGRRAGTPNQATVAIKTLARSLTLEDPQYVRQLRKSLRDGTCPVPLQIQLLHYGFGVPKEAAKESEGRGVGFQMIFLNRPPGYDPVAEMRAGRYVPPSIVPRPSPAAPAPKTPPALARTAQATPSSRVPGDGRRLRDGDRVGDLEVVMEGD